MSAIENERSAERHHQVDEKVTIRLFVHREPTAEDEEALQLFEELKELINAPRSLYTNPTLEVQHVDDVRTSISYRLPRLIDGTMWDGIEEIRTFLNINRHYASHALVE